MSQVDRRDFLKLSASTALGAAALGTAGLAQGPKPLRVGLIGVGGMGNAHLGTLQRLKEAGEAVEIAAVCDVYKLRLDSAAQRTGAQAYSDYRELLTRRDIDAVGIATPDHWHARIAVDAMNAGKDVYCEKPMTYWGSLDEPKAVVKALEANKRVLQVGTQFMSDDIYALVHERIAAGALGGLVHAQATDMRNGPIGLYSPLSGDGQAKPGENLDWDMWIGSAPKVPWNPGRYFAFRAFWDYSGGTGTDFFPHILTPLVRSMGLSFPHRVTASGGLYQWDDGREVPDIFTALIEYPGGPSVMLSASLSTDAGLPMVIRGKNATLTFEGPGAVIRPQGSAGEAAKYEEIARTRGFSLDEHWKDFLNCVRTREQPRSPAQLGYHVMTALHMGIRSYREGRTFEFDPDTETVKPA
jgi:predicted dehydrogenase